MEEHDGKQQPEPTLAASGRCSIYSAAPVIKSLIPAALVYHRPLSSEATR